MIKFRKLQRNLKAEAEQRRDLELGGAAVGDEDGEREREANCGDEREGEILETREA